MPFQSTLPMRGATVALSVDSVSFSISIHTPHAGSDEDKTYTKLVFDFISIHTPHAGSDTAHYRPFSLSRKFQSTLPMRGATCLMRGPIGQIQFQSTLPMRGATVCRPLW